MTTATSTKTITTLVTKISFEDILKTYNGEQGCACGCGGDYIEKSQNPELAAKHLARINARLKSNASEVDTEWNYASIEGVSRAVRVYFVDGVRYSYERWSKELYRIETING